MLQTVTYMMPAENLPIGFASLNLGVTQFSNSKLMIPSLNVILTDMKLCFWWQKSRNNNLFY